MSPNGRLSCLQIQLVPSECSHHNLSFFIDFSFNRYNSVLREMILSLQTNENNCYDFNLLKNNSVFCFFSNEFWNRTEFFFKKKYFLDWFLRKFLRQLKLRSLRLKFWFSCVTPVDDVTANLLKTIIFNLSFYIPAWTKYYKNT